MEDFCIGEIGDRCEENANCLEERVGRVVEAGEGKAEWRTGSIDVIKVMAFDGLRIRGEAAVGIFG